MEPKENDGLLSVDDLRWVENVRNAVGGLAAQADLQCEGCEVPWLAIHYSLESIKESLTAIVEDYKSRLKIKEESGK